jgi:hypothetical protein
MITVALPPSSLGAATSQRPSAPERIWRLDLSEQWLKIATDSRVRRT